jgi:hypothetical protein
VAGARRITPPIKRLVTPLITHRTAHVGRRSRLIAAVRG